ncbi:MAG: heavy metal-associated domain-containing protein, partial [Bacteroidota bacterium]
MQQTYSIDGMSCGRCVAKVKQALEQVEGVSEAHIQLDLPQAKIQHDSSVNLPTLQQALKDHRILVWSEVESSEEATMATPFFWATYKPLLILVGLLLGLSLLAQYPFDAFSPSRWMRHFMAGFFLSFAFFKLINLNGFAQNYRQYDPIAGRWAGWGFVYPFVELALGLAYWVNAAPLLTNVTTFLLLGVGTIGV